ncbi:MAG: molecular chaperone DnaK [Euryarchaeota archaeon]|nr:molecular chaperone DnaK [Euryarchaeota archaeon]
MSHFKPVVGIDLGTTFSAIAYIDEFDKPLVIPNQENKPITASVVNFYDKNTFVVGDEAINRLIADKDHTVSFIKRRMGEPGFKLNIHGEEFAPQKISAHILAKLKKDAESYFQNQGLEIEVKDAVITVPAYFGMEQKGATKEAGELAGLNVLMIMNEPTAAALAFGMNKLGKNQTIFVFDLGGGTFDVTILEIKGNEINMVASDGSPELGGKDWDDLLVDWCTSAFKEKYGEDPQDDPDSYQELYERVLKAKISLSKFPKAQIQVSHMGKRDNMEITRQKFEELSKDLMAQCKSYSERVLEKANKKWSDIDTVLLVGGSTYMPMVRSLIKEISGKEPSTEVNPDQCVAIGAAFQARYRFVEEEVEKVKEEKGEKEAEKVKKKLLGSLPDVKIKECVAKSLGIVVLDEDGEEKVEEMIPEQTDIPCTIEKQFGYAYDNQTSIKAEITEGKGELKSEVCPVGELVLKDLPPRPKGTPIKVIYTYNRDKTLDVEVIDVETGKKGQGRVTLEGSMTDEEKNKERENIARKKQE